VTDGAHGVRSKTISFARAALCATALVMLAPGTAAADLQARSAPTGGANIVVLPKVTTVKCVRSCARRKGIQGNSLLRIKGSGLESVKHVLFTGRRGPEDDAKAPVITARAKKVTARVPAGAPSGAIVLVVADGVQSKPTTFVKILPPPPVIGTPDLKPLDGVSPLRDGRGRIETGTSTPRKVFLGAKQLVRYSLRVSGAGTVEATVNLVRLTDGGVMRTWTVPAPDGQIVSVDWDGLVNGQPQGDGRYAFRLSVRAPGENTAVGSDADPNRDAFDMYGYIFPIRGKHDYGMSAGRFGNNRGSHRHQGQDVFARCGTRLVAARGGVVRFSGFQGAAGNYVVIDTDFSGVDMAYMHLQTPSPFRTGDRVYTGQTIGQVGQTGRATGCHLHFEEWDAPGWYKGGRPFDPLPDMLAWDAFS
jgi:murein DD-endopeptidase MepM/ murein hydrolase activator NlpD